MTAPARTPRHARTPVSEAGESLSRLLAMYAGWVPEASDAEAQFKRRLDQFITDLALDPDRMLADLVRADAEGRPARVRDLFDVACAFCVKAIREDSGDAAWSFACEAAFLVGRLVAAVEEQPA